MVLKASIFQPLLGSLLKTSAVPGSKMTPLIATPAAAPIDAACKLPILGEVESEKSCFWAEIVLGLPELGKVPVLWLGIPFDTIRRIPLLTVTATLQPVATSVNE